MTTTLSEQQNAVFEEAVIALSELSGNNPEILISGDEVLDLYNTQIMSEEKEKEVYDILMDMNSANILAAGQKRKLENFSETSIPKVRKPPISIKCCTLCNNTFHVAAPQKKCMDASCKGELVVQAKEPKVLKRAPPMCSKFCVTCDKMIENIPTACKNCTQCNTALEKVEKKKVPQVVVAMPVGTNRDPLWGTGRNPWD
tara:strand:- start:191 stop:790 length:600 start_codon:yes stop_codon:yes gene_type:complete